MAESPLKFHAYLFEKRWAPFQKKVGIFLKSQRVLMGGWKKRNFYPQIRGFFRIKVKLA
jgi:hypothetical protein